MTSGRSKKTRRSSQRLLPLEHSFFAHHVCPALEFDAAESAVDPVVGVIVSRLEGDVNEVAAVRNSDRTQRNVLEVDRPEIGNRCLDLVLARALGQEESIRLHGIALRRRLSAGLGDDGRHNPTLASLAGLGRRDESLLGLRVGDRLGGVLLGQAVVDLDVLDHGFPLGIAPANAGSSWRCVMINTHDERRTQCYMCAVRHECVFTSSCLSKDDSEPECSTNQNNMIPYYASNSNVQPHMSDFFAA